MIRLRESEFKQNFTKIKAAKTAYREKVELQFQSAGNMREDWNGLQTLTGETGYHRKKENITVNSSTHYTAISTKNTTLLLKYPISKLNC